MSLRISERYLWALSVMLISISLASIVTNELVVRTRTRHRVPPTPRVMHHSSRRRRPVWKRDTQAIRWVLFRTRNPTRPGGTPSGRGAAMGCPRSARPPLEPRGSLPFNMKNERERTRERCKTSVKGIWVLRLCVVQSALIP